jgi:hypothetical protein
MTDGLASLNLSLFDTPKLCQDSPPEAGDKPRPLLTHIKKTRSGRDILVCSVHPAPAEALEFAVKQGLALFTPQEIEVMRGCSSDLVDKIIEVKTIFPGADVAKVMHEQSEAAR